MCEFFKTFDSTYLGEHVRMVASENWAIFHFFIGSCLQKMF